MLFRSVAIRAFFQMRLVDAGGLQPVASRSVDWSVSQHATTHAIFEISALLLPRRWPLPTPGRRRDADPTTALPIYNTTPPSSTIDRPLLLVVVSLQRRPSPYPSSSSSVQDVLVFSGAKEEDWAPGHRGCAYILVH